jgi:hypothetical protein
MLPARHRIAFTLALSAAPLLAALLGARPAVADRGPSSVASTPAKPPAAVPPAGVCDTTCADGTVESCRCLFQPTFEHACAAADAIFIGEVTGADRSGAGPWRYTLRVTCAWKGELGTAVAESGLNGCPAILEKGKSYLVYASWKGDRKVFEIGSCTRTADLSHAADDLKRLGAPRRRAAGAPR